MSGSGRTIGRRRVGEGDGASALSGHHSPTTTTSTGSLSRSSPTSSIHSSGGAGGIGGGDLRPVGPPMGTPPSASLVSRKSHPLTDGTASGTAAGTPSGDGGTPSNRLPKLFVLIERNEWSRVEERVRRHPREAGRWATVRKGRPLTGGTAPSTPAAGASGNMSTPERYGTSSSAEDGGTPSSVVTTGSSSGVGGGGGGAGSSTPERQISRVQCKALHHACQKLRSVYNTPVPPSSSSPSGDDGDRGEQEGDEADPYVAACRAIIALVEAHPRAAGERESRHGCLPLHLAAFGMCGSTGSAAAGGQQQQQQHNMVQSSSSTTMGTSSFGGHIPRPGMVTRETSAPVDLDEMLSGDDDDGDGSSSSSSAATGDDVMIHPPPTPASTVQSASAPSSPAMDVDEMADEMTGLQQCKSDPISLVGSLAESLTGNACGMMAVPTVTRKPPRVASSSSGRMANNYNTYSGGVGGDGGHHRRGHSHDTHDFSLMGMSQVIQSETYGGGGGGHKDRGGSGGVRRPAPISTQSRAQSAPVKRVTPSISASYVISTTTSSTRRDHYSLLVLNALLDAYPRAVKTDSEGGRLPLHTAIAGQASAKVVRTLLRAYPDAARQRTKDGYLPLHLAAHWGVSSLDVVSALLKSYPDAIQGRNRFERTPLEEALVMAGENGRVNQVGLVRALRRHPSFWAGSGASAELSAGMAALNFGQVGDPWSGGAGMMTDLQGLLSPESSGGGKRPMPPSSTMVDVDASFDDDDSEEYTDMVMSRMSPRMYMGKLRAASTAVTDAQVNAAKALAVKTDLVTLIRTRAFSSIPHRLRLHPKEASQPLHTTVRGGYPAKVTPLYLACEYNPTVEVVELLINMFKDGCGIKNVLGGQLALHGACTWNASASVIWKLLEAYPAAAQQRDDLGNLPLHCACFSGTSEDVVEALLKTYPLGVSVTNGQGSAPSHIVRRLRHQNRTAALRVLGRYEEGISRRRREAEQVGRPRPLQQDQRQESVEASLRSGSSPNARRWIGKKSPATISDRPSSSSVRQQSKVHVQPSGPGNDDEDGMLWV